MPEALQQLIYVSAARTPFDEEQLRALLATARKRNQAAAISGLLLHERGSFLQMLEGPKAAVVETFRRIEKDARHHRLVVLYESVHQLRAFAAWSMGFASLSPETTKDVPGYSEFFSRYIELEPTPDAAMARRILAAFRDGRWHTMLG